MVQVVRLAVLLLMLLPFSAAPAWAANNTTGGAGDIFDIMRDVVSPGEGSKYAYYVFGIAIMIAFLLIVYATPFNIRRRSGGASAAYAERVQVSAPSSYDFMAYVIDEVGKSVKLEKFVKIGEHLYVSTSASSPTFLYVPDNVPIYLCQTKSKRRTVTAPCGVAYRIGLLSMLVDPRQASVHELAAKAGLIHLDEDELEKLLSTLYSRQERKTGMVRISPDTGIAFSFNIRDMIKGYLQILRSADEMMIHFLHTANQAESIERFMNAALRLQKFRFSWLRWIAYFVMALGISTAAVMMFIR